MTARAGGTSGSSSLGSPNTQTTNYTFVLGDAGKVVPVNSAADKVVTIPPSSDVPYAVGTVLNVARYGTGAVTVTGGVGVTLRPSSSVSILNQYRWASFYKLATDEWLAVGDINTSAHDFSAMRQKFIPGRYQRPPAHYVNSVWTPLFDYAYPAPWWLPSGVRFTDIGVELANAFDAGSVARLFVVRQGTTGMPNGGAVQVDVSVTIDTSARRSAAIDWTVPADDLYWVGAIFHGSGGTNGLVAGRSLPLVGSGGSTAGWSNQAMRGSHASFGAGAIPNPFPAVSSWDDDVYNAVVNLLVA